MLKLATKFVPQGASFAKAQAAGFQGAEFWLDDQVLALGESVLGPAKKHALEYVLHFPNQLELSDQTLDHLVHWYRELGCRCVVIHQPMAVKFAEALASREPGLILAVENHKLDLDGFERWAVRNSGLTLDVEHLWKFTLKDASLERLLAQVRGFLGRFGHKLRHVHLPGYLPGYDEHRPMYCAREMVFPVWGLLADLGFEGLVVSEVNPEFQNERELRMDVLLFERWREMAGK